jgi:hypothetical protein
MLYNSPQPSLVLLGLLSLHWSSPGNGSNAVDSSAFELRDSYHRWIEPISQLTFRGPNQDHGLSPSCICPPLAGTDCMQTHSQLLLTLRRFRFSRYRLFMDPTENIASHNSSIVACITLATLTLCLLCRNVVTGVFSY